MLPLLPCLQTLDPALEQLNPNLLILNFLVIFFHGLYSCTTFAPSGMKCGGCVGHVKKLLEDHPAVLHATVNLATETALVRVALAKGADLDNLAADLAKVRYALSHTSHRQPVWSICPPRVGGLTG